MKRKLPRNYGSLQKPGRISSRVMCQVSIEIDTSNLILDTTDLLQLALNLSLFRVDPLSRASD